MIQNTLFAKYIEEREQKKIIEDDRGFIIYRVEGEECFLAEMFIEKDHRGSSACADLLRELFNTAKAEGCKGITANIHLIADGAMRVLSASIKHGFRVISAHNNILLIGKEV